MSFRKGLGQFLQERGVLTPLTLRRALSEQEQSGLPLRTILVRDGTVAETEIIEGASDIISSPKRRNSASASASTASFMKRPAIR